MLRCRPALLLFDLWQVFKTMADFLAANPREVIVIGLSNINCGDKNAARRELIGALAKSPLLNYLALQVGGCGCRQLAGRAGTQLPATWRLNSALSTDAAKSLLALLRGGWSVSATSVGGPNLSTTSPVLLYAESPPCVCSVCADDLCADDLCADPVCRPVC